MILLNDDFLRDIKKYPFDLKGRVLDAICNLSAEPKSRRGIRKKGGNYYFDAVGKKWQLSFQITQDGDYLLTSLWNHDMPTPSKTSKVETGSLIPKARPHAIMGFLKADFDALQSSFEIPRKLTEEKYFDLISEKIFPKFRWLADRVQHDLSKEFEVDLHPQLADRGDVGKDPVVWVAFVKSMESHYENQSQLTLHLGIGECIHETIDRTPHFCIKVATFHDKPDSRRFWKNVISDREKAIDTIIKYTKKLGPLYEIRLYQNKLEKPLAHSARLTKTDRETIELLLEYMSPESIKKGFFGFSFNRYYNFYEKNVKEEFSDIEWVADEMVREFSKLMYLYFWFSEDDPLAKIEEYKAKKMAFDDRISSA